MLRYEWAKPASLEASAFTSTNPLRPWLAPRHLRVRGQYSSALGVDGPFALDIDWQAHDPAVLAIRAGKITQGRGCDVHRVLLLFGPKAGYLHVKGTLPFDIIVIQLISLAIIVNGL